MREFLATVGIGFVSGVLSGAFGIGGGVITTPGIRLVLGAPALIAVGTPLPVIIPSAMTGAASFFRGGASDIRAGVVLGLTGSVTAVVGAWLTRLVGGRALLVMTAAIILYVAADMLLQVLRPPAPMLGPAEEAEAFGPRRVEESTAGATKQPATHPRPTARSLLGIGALTGLYSGLLGLGGGFVLVPMLTRWSRMPIKVAIGTSLLAISILAIPGTLTHAALGHVDWRMAAGLAVGVVPGALLGARITLGASDRAVRIGFAVLLGLVGAWLAATEIWGVRL